MRHPCLYFSLQLLHDYDVKVPNFTFYGGRLNERRRNFLSLSKLECSPQEINSRESCLHKTFSANWNERHKIWKNANSFLLTETAWPSCHNIEYAIWWPPNSCPDLKSSTTLPNDQLVCLCHLGYPCYVYPNYLFLTFPSPISLCVINTAEGK